MRTNPFQPLNKRFLGAVVLLCAIVGLVILSRGNAATPNQGLEAEAGIASKATVCQDSGASGSGTNYVKLATSCTPSSTGGSGSYEVYFAYADGNSRGHGKLPSPWRGSADTIFVGRDDSQCCVSTGETPGWDGGAIRIINTSNANLQVSVEAIDMGYCSRSWPSQSVPPGNSAIFTSTEHVHNQGNPNTWDTSDADWSCRNMADTDNCTPMLGTIAVTVNGSRRTIYDQSGILAALQSSNGTDSTCKNNSTPGAEFTPWTKVS